MKTVRIYDATLLGARESGNKLSFKEKLDAVKLLDELKVDLVRLGKIGEDKENVILEHSDGDLRLFAEFVLKKRGRRRQVYKKPFCGGFFKSVYSAFGFLFVKIDGAA